ncbi:uncharacterized PE-PGRS family protein PE_PGRS54-like [Mercenaria mercenaria]|uniref:uncharacterized PE-PGRS family protein PE_PGRS54-like n=1 Tax=Mercenaria mercenaria TaxID=6596 RepID=UPI00234EC201|nr:uncharacterized PE-PGRS family protein PE_PGRS54-like [Mercenaria mercenaria]
MSGAKDWNDLDAGGGGGNAPKRGARPNLQEKMRRRFQHRNQDRMTGSSSENTSPVPHEEVALGQGGAFRQVPEGAAAASHHQRGQRRTNGGETPELNDPDANGNFMFHDGDNISSESGRSKTSACRGQGRNSQGQAARQPTGQDHFDKALNSVLGELNRDEKSQRRQKSQGEAVFENNFDDPEPPRVLNIPAGGASGARQVALDGNRRAPDGKHNRSHRQSGGYSEEADDEDDEMVGRKQEQGKDPVQDLLKSMMGGGQGGNERGDPLAALLGGRPDGNRNNGGLGELLGGGRGNRRQGERNDNEDPFAALLGAGGQNPLAAMMGNNEAQKSMHNAGNDFRSSIVGDGRNPRGRDPFNALVGVGQNGRACGSARKDKREGASEGEEQDEDENDDPMEGEKPVGLRKPKDDPVRAMLQEMTKGMKGSANPLAAVGAAGADKKGRGGGGMEQSGGAGEGNKNSDPIAAFLGGRGGGGSGMNPLTMMRGGGRDGGSGGSQLGGFAMGGGEQNEGGSGMNPLASMMGGAGRGGGSGLGGFAGLMGGKAPGGGGGGDLEAMLGGGGANPLSALMGGGGGGQGGGGNPLASLLGGGGAGNPLAALMGGAGRGGGGAGGNPLAALMGGAGRGGGGAGGNPLAALMGGGGRGGGGAGGNPLAALMGGAGRGDGGGGGGGGLAGLAGMLGGGGAGGSGAGGDQMSQALASVMGGNGDGGANPMAAAMSALMGGGRGKPEGPNEQLLRQMTGQAGAEEDELSPDNAGENDIIQQLLAYEMMRAQSNRAPRAEQAMHTIIVVDTSGSMDGEPLIEAGRFISQFINGLEELQFEYNLQENVALVCVGGETQVVQHFTNDYSLIRRATDSLSAVGSSRLHMGLLIPTSLLSHGSHDNRRMGGIYQMGGHVACPRVILISDGYPNATDDVPGQLPRPDDQMLLAMQSLCVEMTQSVTEKTLCKIYCVPVGNSNLNFMEILSTTSGGKVMQPTDAKHMSRCLLHHVLVSKLHENSKQEPTRDAVAELLKQITATAEGDDINGVFEVIREGEPDVQARDQRVAQEMMQAMQGRGRGRGGGGGGGGGGRGGGRGGGGDMQGLGDMAALMEQGQGQMPGGIQSMMGMSRRGRRGGGIPMMRSRGRPGDGLSMMGGDGQGSDGLSGLQAMLGMGGGRGRGGGGGGMEGLMRIDGYGRGGGGGNEIPVGIGGGGRGENAGGLGALLGMGGGGGFRRGGGNGEGNDMKAMMRMAGGGRGRGSGGGITHRGGDLQGMMRGCGGQEGDGGFGLIGSGDGKAGDGSLQDMLGMGGGGKCGQESGGCNDRAGNQSLEAMFKLGGGAGGLQSMLEMRGRDGRHEQQRDGLGQIPGGSLQSMLGVKDGGQKGQENRAQRMDDNIQAGNNVQQEMLGMGNDGEQSEQGKSVFSQLPGGSLRAMLGMDDGEQNAPGKQRGDTGQARSGEQRVKLGTVGGDGHGSGTNQQSMMGFGGGDDSGGRGQLVGMGDGQTEEGGGLGQLQEGSQALLGMGGGENQSRKNTPNERAKSLHRQERREDAAASGAENKPKPKKEAGKTASDQKVPAAAGRAQQSDEEDDEDGSQSPVLGLIGGDPNYIPPMQNQRANGIFNNVPPMSFGLDEYGNARNVDLMGGLGGNDKEGDELMEKLSEMLGIGDGEEGGGILGGAADEAVGNQGGGGGLLRGLPDMLGLAGGRAGGMPGMPGNLDNQPPNLGGAQSDIRTFLQNMGRESRGQNDGGLRDDDGDVIMGRLGAMNQSQGGAPFAGLGGAGGGNLPFFGGANRGQQAAPFPQGLGQAMNGAPNNLQQLEQMLQNAQGGNQGMPSLEQVFNQLGMGGMGHMPGAGGQQPDGGQGGGWNQ